MAVERAFGILKGRWRILLKIINMPLWNVPDIVTVVLCLHNLCIIEKDEFNMEWAVDAEKDLQDNVNRSLGNLQNIDMFKALETSLREIRELQKVNPEAEETPFIEIEEEEEVEGGNDEGKKIKVERQINMKQILAVAIRVHLLLAKNFYKAHLARKSTLRFESCNYNTSSSESE